jgi:hypothetical protein
MMKGCQVGMGRRHRKVDGEWHLAMVGLLIRVTSTQGAMGRSAAGLEEHHWCHTGRSVGGEKKPMNCCQWLCTDSAGHARVNGACPPTPPPAPGCTRGPARSLR